jgi:hypothetical protein
MFLARIKELIVRHFERVLYRPLLHEFMRRLPCFSVAS